MLKALFREYFDRSPIEPGQIFILDSDSIYNPFIDELQYKVKVLAVKDGWIQYRRLRSGMIDSKKVSLFRFCYKRYQPANNGSGAEG